MCLEIRFKKYNKKVLIMRTFLLISRPDYKYIVDGKRIHKSRYKKSRLGIQGTSITEHQETKRLVIHRIYDCGKIKFEKVIYR